MKMLNLKLAIMLEYQNIKTYLQKIMFQIGLKKFLWLKKLKTLLRNELKEIDLKKRVCYYFYDIIKDRDLGFSDILVGKKLYENIQVYYISYKTLMNLNPLHIRFNKIDGIIRACGGEFRHLVLFWSWIC